MTTEQVTELKVTAQLVDENKEVASVEKFFGIVGAEDKQDEDKPARTIDEIVTEFIHEAEEAAKGKGYVMSKLAMTDLSISTILFLIKPTKQHLALTIPIEKPKPEEKEVGDKADT